MLRQIDTDVMDRLESIGNPLGWRPEYRDEDGNAVMRTDLRLPSGMVRICRMKITPKGLIYDAVEVEGADR